MVSDFEKFKKEEELAAADPLEESPESPAEGGSAEEELVDLAEDSAAAAATGAEEAAAEKNALELDDASQEGEEPPAEVKLSREEIAAEEAAGVMVKYCLFCKETILADALACKYCGHVVHVFEGAVFRQLWWFFWAGVIAFLGSLLPFSDGTGAPVSAFETFPGAFYMVFSIFLVFAMGFNIYSRRLIMGPVFLMLIPAIHCWWIVVGAVGGIINDMCWIKMADVGTIIASRAELSEQALARAEDISAFQFLFKIKALKELTNHVGSGVMLILVGSTISSLTFIFSLFSAVTGGGKSKAAKASKSAKASGKGKGRGRRKS